MTKTRIPDKEIENKANLILDAYYSGKICLPIQVESILEISCGLKLVVEPNLKTDYYGEAFLTANRKQIVVEENLFANDGRRSRLLFSLAHELGHFNLHRDILGQCNSVEEYLSQMQDFDDYTYKMVEREADIFAGFLLLPTSIVNSMVEDVEKPLHDWELGDTAKFIGLLSEKACCSLTTTAIQCKQSVLGNNSKCKSHLQTIIDLQKQR